MSHIRNTIELLAKILRDNGTLRIKAETLRSAKFNKNESTPILWELLFELLYYCEYGKIDTVALQACNKLSQEELVVYVKKKMQILGYYSQEFASLNKVMSSGSRELLLAVGWLLCKENIVQRFMMSCTSPLNDETCSDEQVQNEVMEPPKWSEHHSDRLKQMLWFNNKAQMNMRVLLAVTKEKNTLQHKIHTSTYGVTTDPQRNHLTMFEVYLLRHPDLLTTNLELLENDNERLMNLLKWKDHEDIFWKWMESVLDEKLKEKTLEDISELSTDGSENNVDIMQQSISYLAESHKNLQEAIMKYECVVDQLEKLWESKSVEITESDLDNILCEIDVELYKQRTNAYKYLNMGMSQVNHSFPPRFIYEKKGDNKSASVSIGHVTGPLNLQTGEEHVQDIQDEIMMLWGYVERLQSEIDSKQDAFKSELEDISSRLVKAVCIPPMGRRSYVSGCRDDAY